MERVEKTFLDFLFEHRQKDPGFVQEIEKRYDEWYVNSDPYRLAAKKILALGIFSTPRAHGLTDKQAMTEALELIAKMIHETLPPPVIPDVAEGVKVIDALIKDETPHPTIDLVEAVLKAWGFPNIS